MHALKRIGWWRIALALVIAYFAYNIWAYWPELLDALSHVSVTILLVAALLSLVNYVLRFVRWQLYLAKLGHRVPVGPSAIIYFAGFAFTATPGKVGELMRGALLRDRGVPMMATGAAFVSERLSDLIAVVALAMLGLLTLPFGVPLVAAALAALIIFAALMTQERFLVAMRDRAAAAEGSKVAALALKPLQLLLQVRACHAPRLFLIATVLSIVAWLAEGYAFHLVLDAMGILVATSTAISIYNLSLLVGALSFLPGGVGGAEAAMILLLVSFGATRPYAIAATMIIRVLTLWFAIALGGLALLLVENREASAGRATDA